MAEMHKASQEFGKRIDHLITETDARVKSMVTFYDFITTKLRLKLEEAQHENLTLHTM